MNDTVNQVNKITPSGTEQEKATQLYNAERLLDTAEDRVDAVEDKIEGAYKTGALSRAQFTKYNSEVDALENKLDAAENSLESRFNIND